MSGYGSGPDDPWRGDGGPVGAEPAEGKRGDPEQLGQLAAGQPGDPTARPFGYGYPGGPGGPPERPALPATVHLASALILLRTGLSLLSLAVMFTRLDTHIDEQLASAGNPVSRETLRSVLIGSSVVALASYLFLIWVAIQIRRGRNWARIAALVLAGLSILAGVNLAGPSGRPSALFLLTVASLGSAIALVVLLVTPSANAYFAADRRCGYGDR